MVLTEVSVGHELLGPLHEVPFFVNFFAWVHFVNCRYIVLQFIRRAIVIISCGSVLIDIDSVQPDLGLAERGLYSHSIILKHAVRQWSKASRGIHEVFFLCWLVLQLFLELVEFKLRIFNK